MNKDVAGYIQRLEAENAALREKVRLADELADAVVLRHGENVMQHGDHGYYCERVHDPDMICECGLADLHEALAAYRAGQESEASNAK